MNRGGGRFGSKNLGGGPWDPSLGVSIPSIPSQQQKKRTKTVGIFLVFIMPHFIFVKPARLLRILAIYYILQTARLLLLLLLL